MQKNVLVCYVFFFTHIFLGVLNEQVKRDIHTTFFMAQLFVMLEVKSCAVHRYTLLDKVHCVKCNKECPYKHNDQLKLCVICHKQMLNEESQCWECFICPNMECEKCTRMPGICLWCPTYNQKLWFKMLRHHAAWVLAWIIDPQFMFIKMNVNQNNQVALLIIEIILNYLWEEPSFSMTIRHLRLFRGKVQLSVLQDEARSCS